MRPGCTAAPADGGLPAYRLRLCGARSVDLGAVRGRRAARSMQQRERDAGAEQGEHRVLVARGERAEQVRRHACPPRAGWAKVSVSWGHPPCFGGFPGGQEGRTGGLCRPRGGMSGSATRLAWQALPDRMDLLRAARAAAGGLRGGDLPRLRAVRERGRAPGQAAAGRRAGRGHRAGGRRAPRSRRAWSPRSRCSRRQRDDIGVGPPWAGRWRSRRWRTPWWGSRCWCGASRYRRLGHPTAGARPGGVPRDLRVQGRARAGGVRVEAVAAGCCSSRATGCTS